MKTSAAVDERYSLLNQLPVGVCIIDRNLRVLFWNITMEFWLNIPAEDILGHSLTEFFPRFREMRYTIRLAHVFKGGAPEIFSSQLHQSLFIPETHCDVKYRHHTIVTAIDRTSGSGNDAMITIEDVTESTRRSEEQRKLKNLALKDIEQLKIMEKKLTQSQKKLVELNATKDRFLSIIAHDMREPLSAIVNFSELLIDTDESFTTEEIESCLKELHSGASNLLSLLDNLLTWARAQIGQISYKPTTFDLYDVVEEAEGLLSSSAARKKISLNIDMRPPCWVIGDVNMIRTCLRNIISNAIKFTPTGGMVTVQDEGSGVDEHDQPFIEIAITDTGVGMDGEKIKSLFSIDGGHSTLGTYGEVGTGLGLLLCREFMTKNNGDIRAESQPGQGSRFILRLRPA